MKRAEPRVAPRVPSKQEGSGVSELRVGRGRRPLPRPPGEVGNGGSGQSSTLRAQVRVLACATPSAPGSHLAGPRGPPSAPSLPTYEDRSWHGPRKLHGVLQRETESGARGPEVAPGLNLGPASEPWPESRSLWMHRAEDEGHPHPTMSPGGRTLGAPGPCSGSASTCLMTLAEPPLRCGPESLCREDGVLGGMVSRACQL